MLHIPALLDKDQLALVLTALEGASWGDGRATAGHLSHRVKFNRQIPEDDPGSVRAGALIMEALEASALFISSALPARIVPPLFNRYANGETYGPHIDGAIRPVGAAGRVRTDLSATLFLTAPDAYDGGELCIRDPSGERRIKFAAGDLVLYPASSIHYVAPVTRGERSAAFFWVQSIIRDPAQRMMLFELDGIVQELTATLPDHAAILPLSSHYHNLLRMWADA